MTRSFNRFARLTALVVLAAIVVPQTCLAGGKHASGGGNLSRTFSMKSSGNQFRRSQMSVQPMTVKKLNSNFSGQNFTTRQIKTVPSTILNTSKFNPTLLNRSNGNSLNSGKLSDAIRNKIVTQPYFPGKGPLAGGGDLPFNPFPGGKPPAIDPGNIPPLIDPGMGNGGVNGGPGNGGNGGNGGGGGNGPGNGTGGGKYGNCHKCPWPIFWPIYQGGYWNNCYYGPGYYNTPVIYNSSSPVFVNDIVPAYGTARVDLVLEDVQFMEPATLLVGPAYRVKFRNQGLTAAGKFRVGLVAAVDGQATEQSPKALVDVAGLASGSATEVTIRLPVTAMKLTGSNGQSTVFTHLLVAADFDNSVIESDKTNNVAIIERTMLEVPATK